MILANLPGIIPSLIVVQKRTNTFQISSGGSLICVPPPIDCLSENPEVVKITFMTELYRSISPPKRIDSIIAVDQY